LAPSPSFLLIAMASVVAAFAPGIHAADLSQDAFDRAIRPILREHCLKCHSTEKKKGELDLERFTSLPLIMAEPNIWQQVIEQIQHGEMPPKNEPQLPAPEKERLTGWVGAMLDAAALANAGDPGPVVLRRLSNAEYTYTIRDLTGVSSLNPAREFPGDSAAGEGFMNVGNALVMSPSLLTKYLDAAKEVASHAVLLPDGLRFSPAATQRDWTEEILGQIRDLYGRYTETGGGTAVNLQGIRFDTKDGGVIPLDKYFNALLDERAAGRPSGAAPSGLSVRYLDRLRTALESERPSLLLDSLRAKWRVARPGDGAALAAETAQWQRVLWKFNSVGHIGKAGGPKSWLEPFSPVIPEQEARLKFPADLQGAEVTLYLAAGDAGDGNAGDFVVWREPRLLAPGYPPILLRDARRVIRELTARRDAILAATVPALAAAAEVMAAETQPDLAELARRRRVDPEALAAWFGYLGLAAEGPVMIDSYLSGTIKASAGYAFINGWGSTETPLLTANSSDQHVRIPGNMKPHSVAVHPSPRLKAAAGWLSPAAGTFRLEAAIQHAHPECGNGVTWAIERRRGGTRLRLASGVAQGGREVKPPAIENLAIRPGDLVSILIGARDANHSCDLTAIDLVLTGGDGQEWSLAKEVSPDVLAGNPHADRSGRQGVWHFYTEPDAGAADLLPAIPAGSLLAQWQQAASDDARQRLAGQLHDLLASKPAAQTSGPDAALRRQLTSLGGPLLASARRSLAGARAGQPAEAGTDGWGLDESRFGRRPDPSPGDPASLYVQAPSVLAIRLPADLAAGAEFVTTGLLDATLGAEGTVQLQVLTNRPPDGPGLITATVAEGEATGPWHAPNRKIEQTAPLIARPGSAARDRIEAALDEFRQLFPAALCYTKIVPVDEVITLTLFHREDDHLARLMLGSAEKEELDRLWSELRYVSRDALTRVDVFEQLWQYATQDADPKVFEPLREPIQQSAAAFRELLVRSEPAHLEAAVRFAERASRRPLSEGAKEDLRGLYRSFRAQEIGHEEAIRLLLARGLVSPAFLYRLEKAGPGKEPAPVDDWELASRLSYFLWSSMPDDELFTLAAAGRLREPAVLVAQTRRMLRDPKVRRLAVEFGCAWLHIHGFDELGEKSERHFPAFTQLRGDMYEESIRFFTDFFQNNGSVTGLLDADHTFLNEAMAAHYAIPGVAGPEWRRVDGIKQFARGGILGQAATLAKQSGASRTSPILRGNWVSEVLLGEKLPRPPKDVPQLPEDEGSGDLTVRELTERHSSDPRCASCHRRIDPLGFALEKFDAIGRRRDHDSASRPIQVSARTIEGAEFSDIDGLRRYLLVSRRDAFLKQFTRKLLGYGLGRAVQLSDGPFLAGMRAKLEADEFRVGSAIEAIVLSPQFRQIRGRENRADDYAHH